MKGHISENLKKALLQFDLTEKEIGTYLTLLEEGALSIQDISKNTGINRVTTYAAIGELKEKGLVSESRKGKRRLFVAENPESLETILQEKRDQLRHEEHVLQNIILPSLKAIDINQENKPQIKFFEGLEGTYKVYNDYILQGSDVIGCGSYDPVMKISTWEIEKEYIRKIQKRKIFFRAILENTEMNRRMYAVAKGVMHIKFLPEGTKITSDILVFGGTVALISYEKESATLIEDESIAQAIRMYLDFMWERL